MINYAHRGASSYAPENTIAAFDLGLELKANGIETDIRKTKDEVFVLFHDDNLKRITGIDGAIEDFTYEELCAFDFGSFKGPQYKNEKIVKFEDFLRRYGKQDLSLALEIKGEGIEIEIYQVVEKEEISNYTITSFDYSKLLNLRKYSETPRLGFLTDCLSREAVDQLVEDEIDEICPRADLITPRLCDYAHQKGLTIRAWSVKNYDLMMHCCLCNVDGMTVNFPDLLASHLDGLC